MQKVKVKVVMQNAKLKKALLYGGLVGVGLVIGLASIYKASIDGFYRQINLNSKDESYVGEVDQLGLRERLNGIGYGCWRMNLSGGVVERLRCGEWWLAKGKVKRGVYELIKGMKVLEVKMDQNECQGEEWTQAKTILSQTLGLVSGNTHDALVKEFQLLNEIAKEKCGW